MDSSDWLTLYDSLEVYDIGNPLVHPNNATLNECESLIGFPLPSSYREYAKIFGAGELAGYYRIAVPLIIDDPFNLIRFNLSAHGAKEDNVWEGYLQDDSLIQSMCFFGETIGGEMFAWNTKAITDPSNHEYSIYLFMRSTETQQVASSFSKFITEYCLSERWVNGELWPPKGFLPFTA